MWEWRFYGTATAASALLFELTSASRRAGSRSALPPKPSPRFVPYCVVKRVTVNKLLKISSTKFSNFGKERFGRSGKTNLPERVLAGNLSRYDGQSTFLDNVPFGVCVLSSPGDVK